MSGLDETERLGALYGAGGAEHRDQLRVPPHSIDAEQAVLGGLMLRSSAWWHVCDMLTEGDFFRRDHQLIWRAMGELAAPDSAGGSRREFDTVTVGDWFVSRGLLEHVADGGYLLELATTTPSAANIRGYAEIVADKARLRQLITVGTELVNAGFQPEGRSSVELVGEAQSRIGGLLDSEPCDLEAVAPVMERVFHRLGERATFEGGMTGLSTGFGDLDDVLGGLHPGQLIVLAARPKMGKTTLAMNVAKHCAVAKGRAVAAFSFEMQPEELGDRLLADEAGINGSRIRSGKLDEVDWANAARATKRLAQAPIYVSRPRVARVEHVCAQLRRMKARSPDMALAVIDYLQLMHVAGDNRAAGIGDITRALKLCASEIGITILLLSQLNRKVEERPGDKRPMVSDLRDSGSIEQDADAVIFIYRDEIYHKDSRWAGTAELIVAIQRNGAPGMVRVLYQPELFRFSNLPEYWQPAPIESDDSGGKPAPRARGFRKVAAPRQDGDA